MPHRHLILAALALPIMACQGTTPREITELTPELEAVVDANEASARDVYTEVSRTDDGNLFDEMDDYAAAGLPNAAILEAATANGAAWLRRQDTFGTLQPGQRADFILVDGNPLADIEDVREIQVVVQDGRVVFRK